MQNTCFVIMPIGTQFFGNITITEEELRKKYNYLIKKAILEADHTLEVIRADEEIQPGSISNQIFKNLRNSKYVIADITYYNPNVFYELGIRHATKTGTILIREKINIPVPFDISHLRYIEYTQDITGVENLADALKKHFDFYSKNPTEPDNQYLKLCLEEKSIPVSCIQTQGIEEILSSFLSANPNLIQAVTDKSLTDKKQREKIITELTNNPEISSNLIHQLVKLGYLKL